MNSTFRAGDLTWANACVGNNGYVDYLTYAQGYLETAELIFKNLSFEEDVQEKKTLDCLVYPLCYCIRHSVELYLKGEIEKLKNLHGMTGMTNCELSKKTWKGHDISELWAIFDKLSENFRSCYEEVKKEINKIVLDVAQIDPNGEVFRYSHDHEMVKNLTKTSLINIENLKSDFTKLSENLERISYIGDSLVREYKSGLYVMSSNQIQLNRDDLINIAKQLPDREEWCDVSFGAIKDKIKKEFGISGKILNKAMVIIQNNFFLNSHIGMSDFLAGIDEEDVITFVKVSIKINNLNKNYPFLQKKEYKIGGNVKATMVSARESIEKNEQLKKNLSDMSIEMTFNSLSGLQALIDLGRYAEPLVENYKNMYDDCLERNQMRTQSKNCSEKNDYLKDEYFRLIMRDSLWALRKGLRHIGYDRLLNDVEKVIANTPNPKLS